jgi:hypothetical protein
MEEDGYRLSPRLDLRKVVLENLAAWVDSPGPLESRSGSDGSLLGMNNGSLTRFYFMQRRHLNMALNFETIQNYLQIQRQYPEKNVCLNVLLSFNSSDCPTKIAMGEKLPWWIDIIHIFSYC